MSNFLTLFNQVTTLVATTANITRNASNFNSNTSVFFGAQAENIQNAAQLPQVDVANKNIVHQNNIANQQLQESILQTQEALKEFTQEDKSALIKGILDLPEDMSELLKTISNKNQNLTNAEFMKLLSMLNVNGKEALVKLSKLMVFFGSNNLKGTEKLQEVYTVINACTAGTATNASQLIKNMILLYLPWLPIGESNNFEIALGENNPENQEGENSESDTITILIQTINYSNVRVVLYKEQDAQIKMLIDCVESFPKEELQELINGDSKKLNIETKMSFAQTKNENATKNSDINFNVNVSKFLNPYLMLMAHAVVKAVIQIDKHTTLIEKRKIS